MAETCSTDRPSSLPRVRAALPPMPLADRVGRKAAVGRLTHGRVIQSPLAGASWVTENVTTAACKPPGMNRPITAISESTNRIFMFDAPLLRIAFLLPFAIRLYCVHSYV